MNEGIGAVSVYLFFCSIHSIYWYSSRTRLPFLGTLCFGRSWTQSSRSGAPDGKMRQRQWGFCLVSNREALVSVSYSGEVSTFSETKGRSKIRMDEKEVSVFKPARCQPTLHERWSIDIDWYWNDSNIWCRLFHRHFMVRWRATFRDWTLATQLSAESFSASVWWNQRTLRKQVSHIGPTARRKGLRLFTSNSTMVLEQLLSARNIWFDLFDDIGDFWMAFYFVVLFPHLVVTWQYKKMAW